MSISLDPNVAGKLRQFGRRRFQLLVLRGLCAAIVSFLLCMALVALVDWYWVLTDQVRWGLSIAAYAITIAVVWVTSLRKLIRTPADEDIASHVEKAEPALRENLLSAVELATDDPAGIHDSPVFRSLLQGKVAQQMANIRVPRILPVRLLAKWLLTALILGVGVTLLLTGSDQRFRTLAARAVLPGANIERVSRIRVDILQPTPRSLMVATDETVAVVVAVSGGDVDDVTLETFPKDGEPQRQTMRGRTQSEFAANIHVESDTEYRILAGDAVTMRYMIQSKNRPRVVAFHKKYQYPGYSGLPESTVTEDSGDIVVLEGTHAELELELDQDVSAAELRIDDLKSDELTIIPLERNEADRWCATVPVADAAIYKVHLVSRETGFENIFAPRYEIRPVPDLIPRAGFVDQRETDLLLPPNDILALRGMGEDDLPLALLEQEVSVNGRDWQAFPLEVTTAAAGDNDDSARKPSGSPAYRVNSAWDWDLLALSLRTGDQVMTRLVATDLKGNRGESVPLRIVVSAPEFDPQRHAVMETKAALYDDFVQLAKAAEEHKLAALEIIARLRDATDQSEEQRALDRTSLADLARKLRDASGQLLAKIQNVTRSMPAGADAYELNLAGRVIARLGQEHANRPAALLESMKHARDAGQAQADLDQMKQAFERSADDAKSAAYHYQHFMSHNVLASVALDFDALLQQQQLVVNRPTQTWARLVRQETLLRSQLQVVERLLEDQQHRLPDHLRNHFRQLLDWTLQQTDRLDSAMESEEKLNELQQLAKNLLRELEQRQRTAEIDGQLPARLTQGRHDFDNRSGTLSEPLSLMTNSVREENRFAAAAATAEDSTQATELVRQATRFAAEIDLQHRFSLDQLRIRRNLMQSRIDADPQYAADAGLTSRAVTSLLNQHRQSDPQDSIVPTAFQEIAPAFRILEAGHDLINVELCLANLIQLERWGSQDLAGRIDHPRQWDSIQKGLDEAVNRLRAAGIPQEMMATIDEIRRSPSVQEIGRRIGQRRWQPIDMVSATYDLMDLRDRLQAINGQLKPIMAEARATIAKYAPTIPEMAEQLAQQVRELEEDTTEVADAVEQSAADASESDPVAAEDAPQLADLTEEQQRINAQIDDLFEALVEDANAQDLLDEDQRERARDADDSIALVRDPAEEMNEALREAEATAAPEQQAKELAKAAEQQERTAQALETVAEHFDRLDQGLDVAESRAELRQNEHELGIAEQMDQKFDPAEQLAENAQRDPADLLAELEAELQRNPAMQEALSEISQNALQEARNALQDAANQEQELQRANERSDEKFQAKKKQMAADLRELGLKAGELSRQLAAHANTAASQAKTPEAQKDFAEAQQKLNEAAQAANSANEGELLAQLADKLQSAQEAIEVASQELKSGEQGSAAAKDEEIHADDKALQNAKKAQEDQRQRNLDQRKREADATIRRIQGMERQADQQVVNAQNNVNNQERQVQQAKNNLNRKPDDDNLKRQVDQAEARRQDAQEKLDQAKSLAEVAKQKTAEAQEDRKELDQIPQPPLDNKNPAAQAAEAYASQAVEAAEELKKAAEEIAANADFGKELTPAKGQLVAAANQQEHVTEDVHHAAADVDRAARHERRLENALASAALQQAAQNVEQVADNEATEASRQLDTAQESAADPQQPDKPGDNQPALAANQDLAESEQAIAAQAEALSQILTPMQQADAAAQAAAQEASQQANAEPQNGEAQNGEASQANPAPGSQPPQSFTPEEAAAGEQLAQTLDELDRQMAAQAGQPTPGQPDANAALARAAQLQRQQMASARAQAQQQSALASDSANGRQSKGIPAYDGDTGLFVLTPVNRSESQEWGKLREQAAEDLTKGRREAVSAEYRASVEAYFKVLAERARRNQ